MIWFLLSVLAVIGNSGANSGASPAPACSSIVDVPTVNVTYPSRHTKTPLKRAHDLIRLFSEGDGEFTASDGNAPTLVDGAALYPLPWETRPDREPRARLLAWQERSRGNDESMLAIILRAGERFCTSELDWKYGARLRFEALSIEKSRPGSFSLLDGALPYPGSLSAGRQTDLPLAGTSGQVCFEAEDGAIAVAEPRILEPDEADDRPRFMVLTIVDALRGDLLRGARAPEILPTLHELSEEGHYYERAVAPGCHTRASVWPILMGRDLMRIDPLKRRQSMPIQSPLETVYSRANLFLSHMAEAAGYQSVFLGNNAYFRVTPAFSRYSSWGNTDTGTVDTIAALPALFARYADERIFLVYYVSTPHGQSQTPRRLFEALDCDELEGLAQCRCSYDARVLHADEAIAALKKGLEAHGLTSDVVHAVTADHGELFGEGLAIEGEMPTFTTGARRGAFQSLDRGHGLACHALETDVPIVFHGKGIEPARYSGTVSSLDIFPTMLDLMGLAPIQKLDGQRLPLFDPTAYETEPLVSYGFCSDSVIEGDQQLIWWIQGCRLRPIDEHTPIEERAAMWSSSRRLEVDDDTLQRALLRHEERLRERLPRDTLVFDTANLGDATITVTVPHGRITDYGPASSVCGLELVREARLSADERKLTLRVDGYRGLYHVSTDPPRVEIQIRTIEPKDALHFVGPLQLPLPSDTFDPELRPSFFVTDAVPSRHDTSHPAIRLWWQRYGAVPADGSDKALSDFDRVLREWGYIR